MTAKYVTVKTSPRTARCGGCRHLRNRLAMHVAPEWHGSRCTTCLGHTVRRADRIERVRVAALADLRAALDHGTNDDIARCAFALSLRVRQTASGRYETVTP